MRPQDREIPPDRACPAQAPGIVSSRRRLWLAAIALAMADPRRLRAASRQVVRISTENVSGHVQTRAVARFSRELAEASGGRLATEHHFEGRLFRDRDVIRAMQHGQVQMAVPGLWQLDRFEPHAGLLLLPAFLGLSAGEALGIADGPVGREIASRIGRAIQAEVPGRWLSLGAANVYTTRRPVRSHGDLAGLRIRVAGGEGNAIRLRLLGAEPVVIAWPDLPVALARGQVDGLLTTDETVASARLWEHGVRHAFEDRQYFALYVPVVAGPFWDRLPAPERELWRASWESIVAWEREEAQAAQARAAGTLAAAGVGRTVPSPEDLVRTRRLLQSRGERVAATLGLDPSLVGAASAAIGRGPA